LVVRVLRTHGIEVVDGGVGRTRHGGGNRQVLRVDAVKDGEFRTHDLANPIGWLDDRTVDRVLFAFGPLQ